ncbi:hypothetical protein ACIRVF_30385 [Kitasatospora sp. NPDC101157]|uniref:hypothetical protein n=1 Tax=Kitasatospora sp. NPDC101157 TaxID=3364098 RepID=UPI0037F879C7
MRAEADRIDDMLQQNLYRSNNTGSDQRFVVSDQDVRSPALLDVREHHDARDRTVEVDYVFSGAVPKGLIGWGPGKGVQGCYRYAFTNMLYTLRHRVISCPKDLPPPPQPGPSPTNPDTSSGPGSATEDVWTLQRRTAQLARRIRPADRPAGAALQPGVDELHDVLVTAKIDPALPRTLAMRSGVAVLALGTLHQCVFATMDTHAVSVWPAPFEAPCTTDRAYQSYAMAYWPPLPGM